MQKTGKLSAPVHGPSCLALVASLIWIPFFMTASARAQTSPRQSEPGAEAPAAAAPVVPQQVRYSGKLAERAGQTVDAVFRIYAVQQDGEPLWTEAQRFTVAEDGSYSVLLGSATTAGLPQAVFAAGQARWLGVSVERAPELDRVMLASVPYAMKSADAEALAGHAAADFVTQDELAQLRLTQVEAQRAEASGITPNTSGAVTGSGTAGTVPLWTGALTQGNSIITQVGSNVGINEPAPGSTLTVDGTTSLFGSVFVGALSPATATTGWPSHPVQMRAQSFSSTANATSAQTFTLIAEPANNDTATPSATLNLQLQSGTGANSNILSIAGNGAVTSNGGVTVTPPNTATASAAVNSPLFELNASAWSSGTSNAVAQNFAWQAVGAGNNTATPSANLALLYGSGTAAPASTGLSISPKGILNWAAGQTFPGTGAGTITGITTSSPLTGSGTSGSVALGLNTAALETTLNSVYPQLGAANTFTKPITFASGQTFPGAGTLTGITAGTGLTGGGTSGSPTLAINTALVPLLNAQNLFSNNNSFAGTISSQGTLDVTTTGYTSSFAPNLNSALLELSANAYNSNEGIPQALNFAWQAMASGGNTASPSANLELLYGTGPTQPSATGLSIAPNGIISFASGQTFPGGGGTITGVTAGTDLIGGGSSGSVTLNVDTTKVVTGVTAGTGLTGGGTGGTPTLALNTSVVPLLSANNVFTGSATFEGAFTFENQTMDLTPNGVASPSYPGFYSPVLEQTALAYNTSLGASEPLDFGWQVTTTGGNTASPSASLELLYGANGSVPSATGLSFAPNGIITFASGQTFPGAGGGTITGVTAGTDLTGGGSSGGVTLNVDTTKVVTGVTAGTGLSGGGTGGTPALSVNSAVVPLLAAGNTFSSRNVFADGVTGDMGALSTTASAKSFFTAGVTGDSGPTCSGCDQGGVMGTTDNGVAVAGFAGNGQAGYFQNGSSDGNVTAPGFSPAIYAVNYSSGVALEALNTGYGTVALIQTGAASGLVTTKLLGFAAGLWADAGGESAIIGSSNDYYGGAFFNNSSSNPTVEAINYGGGASGLVAAKGPKDLDGVFRAQGEGGVCGVSTAGDVSCTGQVKTLVTTGGGARKVETYAMQSPENWMEDFGSGELQRGVAVVQIDPAFADTITADASYHVFLTPNGDSEALYVINKTATSFEVRESKGGTSSLSFDYRIVGKRRGYEAQRLTDVTDRFNAEMKAATMPRAPGVASKPAR